jgi:hypothetical protein
MFTSSQGLDFIWPSGIVDKLYLVQFSTLSAELGSSVLISFDFQ